MLFRSTIIHKGVKLDNQIQIAHNVEIGENTAIAAQSGIAGSTKIGKNCMIGGQVGIIGHLKIGDNVKIQAQAGVTSDIKSDLRVTGTPAISYMNYNKSYIHFKNLPDIVKKMKLDSSKCIYIGDTEGDFNASRDNNIDFIFAKYGYGDSRIKFLNEISDISDLDVV